MLQPLRLEIINHVHIGMAVKFSIVNIVVKHLLRKLIRVFIFSRSSTSYSVGEEVMIWKLIFFRVICILLLGAHPLNIEKYNIPCRLQTPNIVNLSASQ